MMQLDSLCILHEIEKETTLRHIIRVLLICEVPKKREEKVPSLSASHI